MHAPNVHIELVHDPSRHRAVIGWSSDPPLLRVAAEQLMCEPEQRAEQFVGIDDVAAEAERSEASRLRRFLELVLPERGGA